MLTKDKINIVLDYEREFKFKIICNFNSAMEYLWEVHNMYWNPEPKNIDYKDQ